MSLLQSFARVLFALCTPLGASGLLLLIYAINRATTYYRLRQFPGPFWASFTKLWLLNSHLRGRSYLDMEEVCDKYGSVARIGPNDLLTNDPEILRRMHNSVRTQYTRSDFYKAARMDPDRVNIAAERDDKRHTKQRMKMAPGYSGKENTNIEDDIDSRLHNLIRLIEDKYLSTAERKPQPMDFCRAIQYFTIDVISTVAFGNPFGFIAQDCDLYGYIKMIESFLPFSQVVATYPIISDILTLPYIKNLLIPSVQDKLGVGRIMALARSVVAERFGPEKLVKKDMLGSFINHGLSQNEVEAEALLQIFAGSDTTATAIRSTFMHLLCTPEAYSRLKREIQATEINKTISSPVKYAECLRLPYLQACVKEGLRIVPPVPVLMPRLVPPQGDTINGIFVPGGVSINHCTWGVQRRKDIYGDDPNCYRPERWLEADEESRRVMDGTLEFVFGGSGRWSCLGKTIALMEIYKVLVELLRRFDFAIYNPSRPWKSKQFAVFLQTEMFVRITRADMS